MRVAEMDMVNSAAKLEESISLTCCSAWQPPLVATDCKTPHKVEHNTAQKIGKLYYLCYILHLVSMCDKHFAEHVQGKQQ